MTPRPANTVADVENFITMLRVACEDDAVHARLDQLLSLPDEKRRALVHAWVTDLLIAEAPRAFVAAIACLLDDGVAEKAHAVIFDCKRGR